MTASEATFGPVTYTMPLERLRRLSRSAARRTYPRTRALLLGWLVFLLAVVLASAILPSAFEPLILGLARWLGLPFDVAELLFFVLLLIVFIAGYIVIRRSARGERSSRVDDDTSITLRTIAEGLHFATPQMDHIVKWSGIHELLREPDGIVVACGNMFFLVPDRVLATADARGAFLDHVASRLTPGALARSETELQRARGQ